MCVCVLAGNKLNISHPCFSPPPFFFLPGLPDWRRPGAERRLRKAEEGWLNAAQRAFLSHRLRSHPEVTEGFWVRESKGGGGEGGWCLGVWGGGLWWAVVGTYGLMVLKGRGCNI